MLVRSWKGNATQHGTLPLDSVFLHSRAKVPKKDSIHGISQPRRSSIVTFNTLTFPGFRGKPWPRRALAAGTSAAENNFFFPFLFQFPLSLSFSLSLSLFFHPQLNFCWVLFMFSSKLNHLWIFYLFFSRFGKRNLLLSFLILGDFSSFFFDEKLLFRWRGKITKRRRKKEKSE